MKKTAPTSLNSALFIVLPVTLAVLLFVLVLDLVAAQDEDSLSRLTIASDPSRDSSSPDLSADGTRVVFVSDSDFLGQGIPEDQNEIWLYDTAAMTFTRVTTASAVDRDSWSSSLSASGTRIVFRSDSDFLGEGILDEQYEVWLYDTATQTLTRITHASSPDRDSWPFGLSADGTKVVFWSDSDFLGQGILDDQDEIWLYDTAAMTVTRITTASDPNRDSGRPSVNADGTKIAFDSDSDFLGQGLPGGQKEIWMFNTNTMTVTRLTTATNSDRGSFAPRLSGDGTKVVFWSDSDFLGQGIPDNQFEIWLYDTATLTLTRVTTGSDSDRDSRNPQISDDGTKVAFWSDSDFLGQGIPDEQVEIWLYNTTTLTLTRLTSASDSDRASVAPYLNTDGTRVVFVSDSDFLGEGIPDDQFEIWLKSLPSAIYLPMIMKPVP